MTDTQTLRKAIEVALKNGWKIGDKAQWNGVTDFITFDFDLECSDKWHQFKVRDILYDHNFAKALWGNQRLLETGLLGEPIAQPQYLWQYHLQQMVISDDPIAYLREHMPDEK